MTVRLTIERAVMESQKQVTVKPMQNLFWPCAFWTYTGLAHKQRKLRLKSVHNIELSE